MQPPPIPESSDEITPAWLTSALRAGGLDDAGVDTVTAEQIGQDRGLVGITLRLRLTGDGVPESLVAKLPFPSTEVRERMRELGTYRREVRFYRELASRVPLRVPRAYFGAYEESSAFFVLLLEDLGSYRFPDDGEGRVEDVSLALREVAVMHAAHWGDRHLPDWLASEETLRIFIASRLVGTRTRYEERMGGISPLLGEIVERLPQAIESGRLNSAVGVQNSIPPRSRGREAA